MVAPLLILGVVALGALAFGSSASAAPGRKRSVAVNENGEVFPVVDTELAAPSRLVLLLPFLPLRRTCSAQSAW